VAQTSGLSIQSEAATVVPGVLAVVELVVLAVVELVSLSLPVVRARLIKVLLAVTDSGRVDKLTRLRVVVVVVPAKPE
jgi:hypothetical protein